MKYKGGGLRLADSANRSLIDLPGHGEVDAAGQVVAQIKSDVGLIRDLQWNRQALTSFRGLDAHRVGRIR